MTYGMTAFLNLFRTATLSGFIFLTTGRLDGIFCDCSNLALIVLKCKCHIYCNVKCIETHWIRNLDQYWTRSETRSLEPDCIRDWTRTLDHYEDQDYGPGLFEAGTGTGPGLQQNWDQEWTTTGPGPDEAFWNKTAEQDSLPGLLQLAVHPSVLLVWD